MDVLDKVVSLAKRRGFVYPGSDIYGGLGGIYDYGPLGVEMKNNLKRLWWRWMTVEHDDIVGIDGAIITHPRVWEASGHVKSFVDPLTECKKCHHRFKADDISGDHCPDCGGELTEPKNFNTLVPTELGVIENEKVHTFLRGEACQTIYLDFKNVVSSMRVKLPFGIVQIGKAFRNEVTYGNFLFRQREFEQWDLQWFTRPEEMDKWFEYWKQARMDWYKSYFNHPGDLEFYKHEKLAHYAQKAFDIRYKGLEMEGIHWRQDWDLGRHSEFSGKDLSFEGIIPWVVETSGGVDRAFLFLLMDAFCQVDDRLILQLHPRIAPYQAAVFPLLANKPDLVDRAGIIYHDLRAVPDLSVTWDDRGNIGKRYYSQDEIGTPWCVTVDFQTLEDDTVTVRDRDSADQERVEVDRLDTYFAGKLK